MGSWCPWASWSSGLKECCLCLQTAQSSHSSSEGFPHFSGLPERLFQWKSNPPHPTLIKICKDQFRLTALFPYQVREFPGPGPTLFTRSRGRGLQWAPAGRNCVCLYPRYCRGADAKEFQVTDSPWRVCGLLRASWNLVIVHCEWPSWMARIWVLGPRFGGTSCHFLWCAVLPSHLLQLRKPS